MTEHPASKSDGEAIDWLIRLTEMGSDSEDATVARREIQEEFNLWATRSPANLRSFLEVASIFEALGECETELIHELVAHVDSQGNIETLAPAGSAPQFMPPKERVRSFWAPIGAIAATLVLVALGILFWRWADTATYRTQPGDWQRVRFEDGSVAFLKEASEIRMSFSGEQRRVILRHGQTVFDVAPDPRRPFFVKTANAEIKVLGTRFVVNYRNGPTRVTVIDGAVRISTASDAFLPGHTRTLNKEEGAEVSGDKIVGSDRSQVEADAASQRDVLVFDREKLSVVAARINLGNRRQLRFTDDGAGQKPISGRYVTDHPEGLVLAIEDLYPDLVVQETADGWDVTERSSGGHTR